MKDCLTVAAIQMQSSSNWKENLNKASILVQQAAQNGAELIILPEFFIRIAIAKDDEFKIITESLGSGQIQDELANIARINKIHLVAGTMPIKSTLSTKCFNTAMVYSPSGDMICYYHKIHLFKFDDGQQKFDETITFTHGNEVKTFQIGDFKFGLGICYDLRFPELFRKISGVDAFIIPAAFTYQTGKAHWEIFLRARAIENQCYVIASNQTGTHDCGRRSFGHSMLIDPWGSIRKIIPENEGFIIDTLKKEEINKIRKELPALNNCRL